MSDFDEPWEADDSWWDDDGTGESDFPFQVEGVTYQGPNMVQPMDVDCLFADLLVDESEATVSDGNNDDDDEYGEPAVRVKARYVDPWVRVQGRNGHIRWDVVKDLYAQTESFTPQAWERIRLAAVRRGKDVK
jgi:hypothetical protein